MSLTEISYWLKKALPYIVLFFLGILIIFLIFKLVFIYIESNQPTEITTSPIFGKVDRPNIKISTSSAGLNFILDNIEGKPVTATDTAKVFFIPKPPTRFGYLEKIYLIAKNIGFDTERIKHKLIGTEASFLSSDKDLKIEISNFNFRYEAFIDPQQIASSSVTLSNKEIENKAVDFLKSVNRYPDELARGTTNIIYLKYDPILKDFVNVKTKIEAQAVEVDFFRPSIDGTPIATPRFFTSPNYVIMIFEKNNEEKIIRSQIAFFEKSEEQYGIYPIITGDKAWEYLTSGQGIVIAGQEGIKDIRVKKMFLSYYDSDIYQSFLQPVYVFLGDNDFVGFVPALPVEYLQ